MKRWLFLINRYHKSEFIFILCLYENSPDKHTHPGFISKPNSMDLNEWSSIFGKVQHFHSRHQKTTSLHLRITLRDKLRVSNEQSLEGAM